MTDETKNDDTNTDGSDSEPTGGISLKDALEAEFSALEDDTSDDSSKDESAQADSDKQDDEADDSSSEDEQDSESQNEETVIQAPEHWSDDGKAVFEKLDEPAREYLLKREKEFEKGIAEKSDKLKPYEEALKPFEPMLKMRGIDPGKAIRYWAQAQAQLDADPKAALLAMAKSYNVELSESSNDTGDDGDTGWVDPEVKKLREEIAELKSQSQTSQVQQQSYAQQDAYLKIQEFSEAKDDKGNLKHPYFEQARSVMQGLIQSGVSTDLEDAYERAVWALPEYRDDYAQKQQKAAEEAAREKREAAAAKAKKTSKTVNGKSSKPKAPPKNRTLADELAEAWDQSVRGDL